MDYHLLKATHLACVTISYAGFFLRGIAMMRNAALLRRRWVRIAPHVVDTVLLLSGIALAVSLRQYPGVHEWLTVKMAALVLYVTLGMVALRHGGTRRERVTAWIAAQAVFFYMVAVARTRNPVILP